MKNGFILALALACLLLGVCNLRLLARIRSLEEASAPGASAARRRTPRQEPPGRMEEHEAPSPAAAAYRSTPPAPAFQAAGIPAPAPKPAPGAVKAGVQTSRPLDLQLTGATFSLLKRDDDLGLTEAQKRAIEGLRSTRDLETQVYRDLIARIEGNTEEAILQVLDPAQRAKYLAPQSVALVAAPVADSSPVESAGPRPGFLGISGGDAAGGGVQISQVFPNTAASGSGLAAGDVILEVNGQPVAGLADLTSKIQATDEGTPVSLKVRRGDSEFYQGVQLGPRAK